MSEPGRALSSRRLISSHCAFAPGRVRWRAKPPRSFSPWRTKTAWPRTSASGQANAPALLVGPPVPDDHAARVERPLEAVVCLVVVLDLDREALDGRIERRALGHRPGAHDSADLQPQVEVVRGRRVLLHDEDPGADAADRELLMALDRDRLDLDRGDARERRALLQEGHELLERRPAALGVHLHAAVVGVAHPAHHLELARATDGRLAEADTLHLAAHDGAHRLVGHRRQPDTSAPGERVSRPAPAPGRRRGPPDPRRRTRAARGPPGRPRRSPRPNRGSSPAAPRSATRRRRATPRA